MSVKFAVIADPHYYSEKLGCTGSAYERRSGSDQKMLAETKGIVKAALDEIRNSDAKFLMIAGDLSNDGERCSHEEIRGLLYDFKKTKPVFVITATHDWCCDGNPRRFDGDSILHDVDTVDVGELRDFYKDFGAGESVAEFFTHQNKSSYVVRPCEGVSVFCLDDDQNGEGGSGYSSEHFSWIAEQMQLARERGDNVVAMQHHQLFLTQLQRVINGRGSVHGKHELCKKFADIGLKYMFTGHSHMQSVTKIESDRKNTFYEINVAAISGYPAPICYCELSDEGLKVETSHLESFTYNGKTLSNKDLALHATALFRNVIEAAKNNERDKFEALLEALDISHKKADRIWIFAKPLLKKLDKMKVKSAARIFNLISRKTKIPKSAVKVIGNILLKDVVFDTFKTILDGALTKHEKGSPYYEVFTSALQIPLEVVSIFQRNKDSDIIRRLTHLSQAADELMTGGELDNNNVFLPA